MSANSGEPSIIARACTEPASSGARPYLTGIEMSLSPSGCRLELADSRQRCAPFADAHRDRSDACDAILRGEYVQIGGALAAGHDIDRQRGVAARDQRARVGAIAQTQAGVGLEAHRGVGADDAFERQRHRQRLDQPRAWLPGGSAPRCRNRWAFAPPLSSPGCEAPSWIGGARGHPGRRHARAAPRGPAPSRPGRWRVFQRDGCCLFIDKPLQLMDTVKQVLFDRFSKSLMTST